MKSTRILPSVLIIATMLQTSNVYALGGTITDFDGKFTLQNVPDNGTIQVSFVGHKTVDIQVIGQSTVEINLEEDTETLDEVVVVGYGVQKKSDVTGAMARVTSKVIAVSYTHLA